MQSIDKLLGRFGPNRQAEKTAPKPQHVVVFNAHQEVGRSVCEALIKGNKWVVWGFVPDLELPVAKALVAMQVKVFVAGVECPGSYERYLEDKDGVFAHFDFEDILALKGDIETAEKEEVRLSKLVVDACIKARVGHLVYSALDDLPENHHVPHCKAKAEVRYIKSTSLPTTFFYTCTPFSTIVRKKRIYKKEGDDHFTLDMPFPDDLALPGYPVEETGEWVRAAFAKPKKWIGQDLTACSEFSTPQSMADELSHIFHQPVETGHISKETFYSDQHRHKIGQVAWTHYKAFYEGVVERDIKASESVVPTQWKFKQWAKQDTELKSIFAQDE